MQMLSDRKIKEVFTNIPVIETERLVLRKIVPEDADDMFLYSSRADVTEYLTWSPHKTPEEAHRYTRLLQKKYAAGAFWDFGIVEKASGKLIGTAGFTSFETDTNTAEIGYVVSPLYCGKGYATEAATAVMKFGFAVFDLDKICARHIDGNDASASVMKKLGMSFVTTYKNSFYIKNTYKTVHEYAVTKKEFFSFISNL